MASPESLFSSDPSTSTSPGRRRAVLLVVERDPHVRELASYFLRDAGYDVHFAEDGMAALELAHKLKPRIIVTEVIVPKLDGLSLCRMIKTSEDLRDTIVVVFSLLAVEQRAREAGADAFVKKPLGADRLIETLRGFVSSGTTTVPLGRIA